MERFKLLLHPESTGSKIPDDVKNTAVIKPTSVKYKVNSETLNVRGGPGTNFDILKWGPLKKNNMLTLVQEKGDWAYIQNGNNEGWVFGQYITPTK